MKLDAKVKGGLAWAGLFVILAVPAADLVFSKSGASNDTAATAASAVSTTTKPALTLPVAKPAVATDPVQTASVGNPAPVDKYLESGKKLPSYISDGDTAAATPAPAPVTLKPPAPVTPPVTVPSEVATVAPAEVAPPVPLPRSARPQTTAVASLPAREQPLIVDETRLNNQAGVDRFPLSDESDIVRGDELEEWDTGSLADYLERRGLLSGSSTQAVQDEQYYRDVPSQRRRLDEFFLF
jgi:hypothetical protein